MANGYGQWPQSTIAISHEPSAMTVSVLSDELPKHVWKNAAVTKGDQFLRRVDARGGLELGDLVLVAVGADHEPAAGPESLRDAGQFIPLAAGEAETRRVDARLELQRQHAHVHQVAAVNTFEAFSDDRFDT